MVRHVVAGWQRRPPPVRRACPAFAFADTAMVLEPLAAAGSAEARARAESVELVQAGSAGEAGLLATNFGPATCLMRALGGTAEDAAAIAEGIAAASRSMSARRTLSSRPA